MKHSIILTTLTTSSLVQGLQYLPNFEVSCDDTCPRECKAVASLDSEASVQAYLDRCAQKSSNKLDDSFGLNIRVSGDPEVCGDRAILSLGSTGGRSALIKKGSPIALSDHFAPLIPRCNSFVAAAADATGSKCRSPAATRDAVMASYDASTNSFVLDDTLSLEGSNQLVLIGNSDCLWSRKTPSAISAEIFIPFVSSTPQLEVDETTTSQPTTPTTTKTDTKAPVTTGTDAPTTTPPTTTTPHGSTSPSGSTTPGGSTTSSTSANNVGSSLGAIEVAIAACLGSIGLMSIH